MRRGIGVIAAGLAGMAFTVSFAADPPVKAAWAEKMTPWLKDATHCFVAPDGKAENSGAADAPWDLASVLDGTHKIAPATVVWMRGGTYGKGSEQVLTFNLAGTVEKPIVVRAYPGERATINGGVQLTGSYTWMWGLEITNTSLSRKGSATNSTGAPERPGMDIRGPGSRAINLVIHDIGHPSPGFWIPVGDGGELHGCLMWANGLYPQATFPAGSMYAQNADGTRTISDNIAFRNFTIGVFCGSSGAARIDGFHIEGNISFDHPQWNLFMHSKSFPMRHDVIVGNCLYSRPDDNHKSSVQLGYWNIDNEGAEVRDNYIVMGAGDGGDREFFLKRWMDIAVTGNTIVGPKWLAHFEEPKEAKRPFVREWDRNHYYGGAEQAFKYGDTGSDFAAWQKKTGFDARSTWSKDYPTGAQVFVRANKYEPGRGHVAICNWDKKQSVEADVSTILHNGDRFEVRDAQNYYGKPVLVGTYDGKPLVFPMNLTEVAQPVGEVPHIQARFKHTAPEFAAFVVCTTP